jgi:hypothetical protein
MQTVSVFIAHGRGTFLDCPATAGLKLGPATTQRYSAVEPSAPGLRLAFRLLRALFGDTGRVPNWTRNWPCLWLADIRKSGGPVLPGRWRDRKQAIAAEIEHFNKFGIQKERKYVPSI